MTRKSRINQERKVIAVKAVWSDFPRKSRSKGSRGDGKINVGKGTSGREIGGVA